MNNTAMYIVVWITRRSGEDVYMYLKHEHRNEFRWVRYPSGATRWRDRGEAMQHRDAQLELVGDASIQVRTLTKRIKRSNRR